MEHHSKPLLLIFPFGYMSHYLRCIVLSRYLRSYFEIRFCDHVQFRKFVNTDGFDTFECASINEADTLSGIKDFDFSWLNQQNLEKVFLSQVETIRQYRPAAVLGDAVPTLKMAAEHTGVRFISLINGYMSKYYAGTRSLSKTHPAYPLVSIFPAFIQDFLTSQGEAIAMKDVHKPFKKLRIKYGLNPQQSYLDELEGDHNMICDELSFFPQKELPENYTRLGPLIYDEPTTSNTFKDTLDPDKKTIFVSMGSTGSWQKVGFLNHENYNRYNIVTADDKEGVLNALHIRRTDFVLANDLLPVTDLVICHGGNGTIYQGLSYGIPLLCKPVHFEQEWNVGALEKLGLVKLLDQTNNKLIEEWTNRKSLSIYNDAKNRIRKTVSTMKEKIQDIATHNLLTACIAAFIFMVFSSFNFAGTTVSIEISNLKGNKGSVLVSLYNNAKYFAKDAAKAVGKTKVSIQNGVAVATFTDLPKGKYAAAILHDENNNLKMDFNFVGMPKEGYGFSNNAKGVFGPPSFEKAAFDVVGDKKILIKATYFLK